MSRLGFNKSLVYRGDMCLGELDVIPVKDQNFQFPNNQIRIHRISSPSERCPPLSILQTISPFSLLCKLESSSPVDQPYLTSLHASCNFLLQTAVVPIGTDCDEEIHLVAMRSKQRKYPCFWCYSVPKGLYDASSGMLNTRYLPIVFDLDDTLVAANSLKSYEDKIRVVRTHIASETNPLRLAELNVQLKRFEDDELILKQYAENNTVMFNGKLFNPQIEEVSLLCDNHERKLIQKPVIRLQEMNIVLTRINPEIRDTSVLVRLRPAWKIMRNYLTTEEGRKRFEVYVCTMAERDYALEMWRLLDPDSRLIDSNQILDRLVCVKSGSKKSLINVFQGSFWHSKMAMVIDDRLDVWEDKDQPQVHEIPAFTPYCAPEEENRAYAIHVLRIARNVAFQVRTYFFKDFDGNFLQKTSAAFYEDDVVTLPSSLDMSSYLKLGIEKMSFFYSLFHQNKLTGQNYIDWKHNLVKFLNVENYNYVLTQPCPAQPAPGVNKDARMPYEKWQKANDMAKYYIMASISNVLQTKHQTMFTAVEIMDSLEQMFSQGTHSKRQEVVPPFIMKKGMGVHCHALNDLKIQKAQINEDTKIDMALESLQKPFKQLLMNKLHAIEGSIINTEANPSKPKPKGLWKKNQNKKKIGPKKPSMKKDGKLKGKCFKCGEKGHWKLDCPKLSK